MKEIFDSLLPDVTNNVRSFFKTDIVGQTPVPKRTTASDVFSSAQKAGVQIREKIGKPMGDKLFTAMGKTFQKTMEVINPGQSYVEPTLEKFGVNPSFAAGVGLGIDIVAPGPGELSRGKKLLPLADDIISQAKKYKTAEKFVEAQTNAYHGSYTNIDKFEKGYFGDTTANNEAEVFYFTKSEPHATEYSREAFARRFEGEYGEKMGYTDKMMKKLYKDAGMNIQTNPAFVDIKNPKIMDWKGQTLAKRWEESYEFINQAKDEGYDGVIFKNISDDVNPASVPPQDVVIAFNPEQIKTKSQLTDIWKKANK